MWKAEANENTIGEKKRSSPSNIDPSRGTQSYCIGKPNRLLQRKHEKDPWNWGIKSLPFPQITHALESAALLLHQPGKDQHVPDL